MLWTLLKKDFSRVLRNPWPLLLNLSLPLAITALIGLTFGRGGKSGATVAAIRVAIVDEDRSFFGAIFQSALKQGDAGRHFEVLTPTRDEAGRLLRENKVSAILVVPERFTRDYFAGKSGLELELIKNPAQVFYPAVVEELGALAVAGLNALARALQGDFPRIQSMLTNRLDFAQWAGLITSLGDHLKGAGQYVAPPLVTYRKETLESAAASGSSAGNDVFGFILPGMASAFLLFMAEHSMRDLHREKRARTLDRVRCVTGGISAFVTSKVFFAALIMLIGSAILFAIGGLVFQIHWPSPALLALMCGGYAVFGAGFAAMLLALSPSERRSESLNPMLLFLLSFVGGSYLPINQLPPFVRDHISPLTPNYWFIESIRRLDSMQPVSTEALLVVSGLAVAGGVLAILATIILQSRLTAGARS